ncbi:MAG: hypothetical protein ACXWTN_08775, partial [Methylosarcina sp.]
MIGFIDGLFPFAKRSQTQENHLESLALSGVSPVSSGGAGELSLVSRATGVSQYLNRLPIESGVAKYLKKQEAKPATGVAKYLTKKAVSEKDEAKVTRVTRYLTRIEAEKPLAS